MLLRLSERPERDRPRERLWSVGPAALTGQELLAILLGTGCAGRDALTVAGEVLARSEEHTSELQSQSNLVCRLLLEKQNIPTSIHQHSKNRPTCLLHTKHTIIT